MFENYTPEAQKTIYFASQVAKQTGQTSIEPEHLLLGLLHMDAALLSRVLSGGQPTTAEAIRQRVLGDQAVTAQKVEAATEFSLSPASKQVLRYAAEESDHLRQTSVNLDHLLLGLIRKEDSKPAAILRDHGITYIAERRSLEQPGHGSPGTLPGTPIS